MLKKIKRSFIIISLFFIILFSAHATQKKQSRSLNDIVHRFNCKSSHCLVMIGSDDCSSSNEFKDYFLNKILTPPYIKKRYVDIKKISRGDFFYGTPFFVIYQNSFPIDISVGVINLRNSFAKQGNQMLVDYLLTRNGLLTKNIIRNKFIPNHLKRKDIRYSKLQYANFRGFNFSNKNMRFFIIIDSILDSSNFEGADLTGAIFSHVNLKKSNFNKSILQNVIWINVICPDGSNSEKNGKTCEGHLLNNLR